MKKQVIISLLLVLLLFSCHRKEAPVIYLSAGASPLEQLASKELRRYLFQLTGSLPDIIPVASSSQIRADGIVLMITGYPWQQEMSGDSPSATSNIQGEQSFSIVSRQATTGKYIFITGGSALGTLYGTYSYLEKLGVRFYLHGDILPDKGVNEWFKELDVHSSPVFTTRGIQPFHDFPEGPDWWNLDDYKAILEQLGKMKMNFIGFHTYPEMKFGGWAKAEPMVWIGLEENINPDGTVKTAYPVLHSHTQDSTWANLPKKTSEFPFGASLIFESDNYGADIMKKVSPWPHSEEENIGIFNEMGSLLKNAFSYARRTGIKTCVGTETPLYLPASVRMHLKQKGIDPTSEEATRLAYEGIFSRIAKMHPLDYYWFWTPEGWTWSDIPRDLVRQTEEDMLIAIEAAQSIHAPFTLATCGWVLGPPGDRSGFDKLLPPDMPLTCINRLVGFTPVEPGFANIKNHPKWAIPWMEDDPALTSPQLWAGRVLKDALDARRYGCDGLLGIHWRTQVLSPNFGALALAGWDTSFTTPAFPDTLRCLPTHNFYLDWCTAQFGKEHATELADIFASIDGDDAPYHGHLYRASNWAGPGPGGVTPNTTPWDSIRQLYTFIDRMESLEPVITGVGNRDRYHYWLNTFRYSRKMAETGCLLGQIDIAARKIRKSTDEEIRRKLAEDTLLPLRDSAATCWGEMVTILLSTIGTTGEMGTVANLQMHSLGYLQLLNKYDALLDSVLVRNLPPLPFWNEYRGDEKIIVTTKRGRLEPGEDLRLKVIILSKTIPDNVLFHWRPLGEKKFSAIEIPHEARGVYRLLLPAAKINGQDFEYYISTQTAEGKLIYPATAPEISASVIVW